MEPTAASSPTVPSIAAREPEVGDAHARARWPAVAGAVAAAVVVAAPRVARTARVADGVRARGGIGEGGRAEGEGQVREQVGRLEVAVDDAEVVEVHLSLFMIN
eukprot:CAMPEP_0179890040 /NCGR_PEP_ID=MMETSP0982-20121206/32889_1 /TAXON_ID=483367 /ORGANISM="non described non described, Strain CCMP 2436" /LENGTH=103 /DNA_ID=CAMNT_0021786235 /DNA_START=398 /DNA_END=708 /DNA_ORIENTATION=+